MIQEEFEHEIKDSIIPKKLKKFNKKWLLIPSVMTLIITPTLIVTLNHKTVKSNQPTWIVEGNFKYQPLDFAAFKQVVINYSKIKQNYIANIANEIDLYLPTNTWEELVNSSYNSPSVKLFEDKIITTFSNTFRLLGLIDSEHTLNASDYHLANFGIESLSEEKLKFKADLKYNNDEVDFLAIGGFLNRSQTEEISPPLKELNNETMPKLINRLNNDNDFKNRINWIYGFSYYGMETIGKKDSIGRWIDEQRIDLKSFNKITVTWFLDFLKKTNLIDYNINFQNSNFNFFVEAWKPENLLLKNKEGLKIEDNYVVLSADNCPYNDETGKWSSVIATIDFGWYNQYDRENPISTIGIAGSYLAGPVWQHYV